MDIEIIKSKIYQIRGYNVMLDLDLAEMYQVETKYLKRSVRRNIERFPNDFMFELTKILRCNFGTLKTDDFSPEYIAKLTKLSVEEVYAILKNKQ